MIFDFINIVIYSVDGTLGLSKVSTELSTTFWYQSPEAHV